MIRRQANQLLGSCFLFRIFDNYEHDTYDLYLRKYDPIGRKIDNCIGLDNNKLVFVAKKEGSSGKPILVLEGLDNKKVLQAIADGLAEFGIFPKVENKEKIKQQAIADERLREIKYFQTFLRDIVLKEKISDE